MPRKKSQWFSKSSFPEENVPLWLFPKKLAYRTPAWQDDPATFSTGRIASRAQGWYAVLRISG
jgi:hypothetical protein